MLQNTNKVVTKYVLYFTGNKLGVFKSFMHKNILYRTFSPLSLSLSLSPQFVLGFDEHGEFGEELPEGQVNTVSDVLLPPWAETAEKFIDIHSQVCSEECVYVIKILCIES